MKQNLQSVRHTITDISPTIGTQKQPPTAKRFPTKIIVIVLLVISLCIVVTSGVLIMRRNRNLNYNDVKIVKDRVSRHVLLPNDEEPALATVTDSSKLTSSFKGKVQNGDKLIIYQNNKKAIVYRPSIDRVITIEPVIIDDAPGAAQKR